MPVDLLKKHYEKILLGGVLLVLAVSAGLLPVMISGERDDLRAKADEIIRIPPKALPPLNLSTQEVTLRRLEAGLRLDLTASNKVFNPVLWQKMPDGRLLKVQTGDEVGPRALVVTRQTPLFFSVTFDSVSTNDAGLARYVIGVEREAAPEVARRRKKQYFVNVGNKNDAFQLRAVKGTADGGTELVLDLADTGETVSVFKEKPFKREDGYTVDLKYDPENKKWTNQRVGGALSFASENYIIVAITKTELVVLAKANQKKTPVPIVIEAKK
jgi:hypothetical protein